MPILGDYQSTTSVGFIFGCIIGPLFIVLSLVYLYLKGSKGNDIYKNGTPSNYPVIVLCWRVVACVFCIVTLGYTFAPGDVFSLSYFTVWNWILVVFYFIISTMVSVIRVFYPHTVETSTLSRVLLGIHQITGEVEFPMSWLVAAVVWLYLAPNAGWTFFTTYTSISQHAVNAVIMSIDFAVAGYGINPHHFPLVLIWPALYVCWHLIGNAAYGLICYPFMKTDDPIFIGWVFGLALACQAFFWSAYGFSILKRNGCACRKATLPEEDDEMKADGKLSPV